VSVSNSTRRRVVIACLAVVALAGAALAARPWRWLGPPRESDAAAHWRQAEEALAAQDFSRARDHLQHCLDVWPAHAESHFRMARACRRADDPEGWQTHLATAEALQWRPEDVAFERLLMQAQGGRRDALEGLAARLGSIDFDEELIFEALVKGCVQAYRLPEAAYWAGHWIEGHPGRWQPWLYRGRSYFLNHDLGKAIPDYRRALEVFPGHRQGRLWLAAALVLDGQFDKALPRYEAYVADYPDDTAGQLGVAHALLELNRKEEAQAALDRLLEREPKNTAGLFLRARLEMSRDAPEQALTWLKKAEEVSPHEVDLMNAFILAYNQLNRPEEAKTYQQRMDRLSALARRLDEVRSEILRSPTAVGPRREAGTICLRLGQPNEALGWLMGALGADPNDRPTHEALADCFRQLGDEERAAYHRQRAGQP
jgi:tetratricopeptide (TPR) repeat protein